MRNTATESQQSDWTLKKLLNVAEECRFVFLYFFFLLKSLICHSRREREYFEKMLNYSLKKIKKKIARYPAIKFFFSESRTGRLCFTISFVLCDRLCSSVFIPAWNCLLQSKKPI